MRKFASSTTAEFFRDVPDCLNSLLTPVEEACDGTQPGGGIGKSYSFKSQQKRNQMKSGGTAIPNQKTVHSGWLWKRGASFKSNLVNRRWFEIKGDQLYYFKDKSDVSNALGSIPLPGNEIRRHPPVADTSGKYVFELIPGKEREGRPVVENADTLLFGAATPYEMEEWIKAINRVIYTPLGGGMFGRTIIETIKIDSRRGGGYVPIIVEQCVEYIRKYGMNEEGIFRVSGSQEDIERLKTAFNTGALKEIPDGEYKVTTVASVLKKYIGDLPNPVIPAENYDQFTAVGAIYKTEPDVAIEKFNDLLKYLPREHFNLLKYLCRFLYELQSHENVTKMTMANLSLIFGPNLLRPKGDDADFLLKSLSDVNRTTMAIINAQERLFPKADDEKCYSPGATSPSISFPLIDFDDVDVERSKSLPFKQAPLLLLNTPPSKTFEPLSDTKRSFSDSSLNSIIIKNESATTEAEEIIQLREELDRQRYQFDEQIKELEQKVDAEIKIREMLKLRLEEEHTARIHAEERLELYRAGIENYCKKFGHADISIA